MAVLVSGGAGYIGSHMAHALVDRGEQVVVIDDLSTGNAAAVPPAAELIVGDIGDGHLLADVFAQREIDTIAHFAAATVVPDSVRNPMAYYRNNTISTHALVSAALDRGIRNVVFSSTAAVYGGSSFEPIGEDAPTRPESPYGWSKLFSERMLLDCWPAFGLRSVIFRYFNVAGADPLLRTGQSTPNATHLIKVACEAASNRREGMSIFGTDYPTPDGTCIRDFVHVCDLVDAHLLGIDYLRHGGEPVVLNCGYGHGYSVREVIRTAERVAGQRINVMQAERRPGDPVASVAHNGTLKRVLGWTPRFDALDTIIEHSLAWETRTLQASQAGSGGPETAAHRPARSSLSS